MVQVGRQEVRKDQVGLQVGRQVQKDQVEEADQWEGQEAQKEVQGDLVVEVAQLDQTEELVAQQEARVVHRSSLVATSSSKRSRSYQTK